VLATGSNESIRLWNPTTGVQIGDSIDGMANAVMFSPAELVLAVSSLDRVILWDIETRTQRGQLPIDAGARALRSQFTSDGRYIAVSGFTDSVRVWDMETMERVGGPLSTPSAAVGLSFSPDDSTLLIGDPPGTTARFWDMRTRLPIGPVVPDLGSFLARYSFDPSKPRVATPQFPYLDIRQLPTKPPTHREMQVKTWLAVGRSSSQGNDTTLLASSEFSDLREDAAAHSRDKITPGLTAPIEALSASVNGLIFAFSEGSETLRSGNRGISWDPVPQLASRGVVESGGKLVGLSDDRAYSGRLVASADGGRTWTGGTQTSNRVTSLARGSDGAVAMTAAGDLWQPTESGDT